MKKSCLETGAKNDSDFEYDDIVDSDYQMELVATWNDYFFHAQVKNANFLCVTHVCDASIIGNNPKQRMDIKPQKTWNHD